MTETNESRSAGLLSRFENPGLSARHEKTLTLVLGIVAALFAAGWATVVADAATGGAPLRVSRDLATSPLSSSARSPAPRVLDRLAGGTRTAEWRGRSGAVRALITEPGTRLALADTLGLDSLPADVRVEVADVDRPGARRVAASPDRPGVFSVILRLGDRVREVADVAVLSPVPADLIEEGRLGEYLIGDWPTRSERPAALRTEPYDAPAGLIAVTPSNRDVPISDHLTLGDFLTKGQEDVWPKYVAIAPQALDKLELTLQELGEMGHPVENVGVISAFRTPHYNAHGGSTSGRGSVSRHMYGDAIDFYIDNDGDGRMDDLNGDGRVDRADAAVVAEAAERVERKYPEYVGGIGTYSPNPGAHAGFVHIDVRGSRARW